MARNINEILENANSVTELKELIDLWNEIANNKYSYSLVEIRSANEHIRKLALKSNGQDIDKAKFYHCLVSQCANSF